MKLGKPVPSIEPMLVSAASAPVNGSATLPALPLPAPAASPVLAKAIMGMTNSTASKTMPQRTLCQDSSPLQHALRMLAFRQIHLLFLRSQPGMRTWKRRWARQGGERWHRETGREPNRSC